MRRTLGLAGVFLVLSTLTAQATPKKIAVLEFINQAKLKVGEVSYLADLVRTEATLLPRKKYTVMTRENMLTMLPEGTSLSECEGACEVETGRNVGADYVVSGRVVRFGRSYKVTFKLHDTRDGMLVVASRASARSIEALEKPLTKACRNMFKRLKSLEGDGAGNAPKKKKKKPKKKTVKRVKKKQVKAAVTQKKKTARKLDPNRTRWVGLQYALGATKCINSTCILHGAQLSLVTLRWRSLYWTVFGGSVFDEYNWLLATGLGYRTTFRSGFHGLRLGVNLGYGSIPSKRSDNFPRDGVYFWGGTIEPVLTYVAAANSRISYEVSLAFLPVPFIGVSPAGDGCTIPPPSGTSLPPRNLGPGSATNMSRQPLTARQRACPKPEGIFQLRLGIHF